MISACWSNRDRRQKAFGCSHRGQRVLLPWLHQGIESTRSQDQQPHWTPPRGHEGAAGVGLGAQAWTGGHGRAVPCRHEPGSRMGARPRKTTQQTVPWRRSIGYGRESRHHQHGRHCSRTTCGTLLPYRLLCLLPSLENPPVFGDGLPDTSPRPYSKPGTGACYSRSRRAPSLLRAHGSLTVCAPNLLIRQCCRLSEITGRDG
jgi:hypothetical protein